MLGATDVAVGLAFIAAAAVGSGPRAQRLLIAALGVAWLAGSVMSSAHLLHQGVLVVALLAFPAGLVRGFARWALVAVAALVALGYVPQLGVVVLFAATAALALAALRDDPAANWYPAAAAGLVGTVLAWIWSATHFVWRSWTPDEGLLTYQTALFLVAVGFVVSTRFLAGHRQQLADRLLTDEGLEGLDGLARVLGDVLDDPGLRVILLDESTDGDADSRPSLADPGRQLLIIGDGGRPVAAVEHRDAALADPPTAAAVSAAVRLVVANVRLQEALRRQLDELDAARGRLLAAGDLQRSATATLLRDEVVAPVESAANELRQLSLGGTGGDVVDIAVQELAGAATEIEALVAGVPREQLGDGRLLHAVQSLARRSPVAVSVTSSGDAAASVNVETTLLYVVSEALANAAKHAEAGAIDVDIRAVGRAVSVTVTDDGRGGADVSGSGLQGLVDRMAARGGRLRVDSPPGAGTTVVATIPR